MDLCIAEFKQMRATWDRIEHNCRGRGYCEQWVRFQPVRDGSGPIWSNIFRRVTTQGWREFSGRLEP